MMGLKMSKEEMKKRGLVVFYLLAMIGFVLLIGMQAVSADLGTFKLESCVDIKTILNTTSVTLSTLSYPNGTTALSNIPMTNLVGKTFNITFCNNQYFGVYNYDYYDAEGNAYVNSYSINGQGQSYSTTQGLVYGVLFVLLIVIFLVLLYGGITIDGDNFRNEIGEVFMVNYNKYLKYFFFTMAYVCFVGLTFFAWNIASGILNFESLGKFLFVLHRISFIGMSLVIPFIFIYAVRQWIKKDNPIIIQLQRGLTVK